MSAPAGPSKVPQSPPRSRPRGRANGAAERGPSLDYDRAVEAVAKGATARKVAIAAGSNASPENLKRVGQDIRARLTDRGDIVGVCDRLGMSIERLCAEHIDRALHATQTINVYAENGSRRSAEVINHGARHAALVELARLMGLYDLPPKSDQPYNPLDELSDDQIMILAEISRGEFKDA